MFTVEEHTPTIIRSPDQSLEGLNGSSRASACKHRDWYAKG